MKFIILILSFFLISVSSYSQDNTKSNVEFTSDSLEVDENKNLMIAKGNVIIKSEKETIKADVIKYDKSLDTNIVDGEYIRGTIETYKCNNRYSRLYKLLQNR